MASSQSGTSERNSTGSNLSLTFNCDQCGNDVRFDRANDEGYKYWIYATLFIQYTKEGIEPLAEDLVKRIHTSIKTFLEEAEQCSCKLKSLHNDGFKCKSGKCTDMKREILKYFLGRSKPNWSVGSSKRQICDSDKHFFKLLMPSRYSGCYDPSDVDCSALFELFEMTKISPIHLDYPSDNLHKVRNARNNLMHTGTMRLQWSDLEEYGNNCLEFLEEINSTNDEFLKRKKKKSEDIRMILGRNVQIDFGDAENIAMDHHYKHIEVELETLKDEIESNECTSQQLIEKKETLKKLAGEDEDSESEFAAASESEPAMSQLQSTTLEVYSRKEYELHSLNTQHKDAERQHEQSQSLFKDDIEKHKTSTILTMKDDVDSKYQEYQDVKHEKAKITYDGRKKESGDVLRKHKESCCVSLTNPGGSDAVSNVLFNYHIKKRPRYDGRILELELELFNKKIEQQSPICEGGYGQVYHVKEVEDEYVIKKISCKENGGNQLSAANEMLAAGRLMHFAIVPLVAMAEKQDTVIYFLFPYMKLGNLADKINSDRLKIRRKENVELTKIKRRRILVQIASAIERLHSVTPGSRRKYIHGDITTKNIVLDTNYNARLTDFGLSRECAADRNGVTYSDSDRYGTPGYYQTIQQKKLTAEKDMFCFGVVLLEVLTSAPAIDGNVQLRSYKQKTDECVGDYDRYVEAVWGTDSMETYIKAASMCLNEQATSNQILELVKRLCIDNIFWNSQISDEENQRCVICMVNPANSQESSILEHNTKCNFKVCVPCMRNSDLNPIQCPSCLEIAEPTIGNKWASILISGRDMNDKNEETFKFERDTNGLRDALISRHPQAIGIRNENVNCVEPNIQCDAHERVKQCFDKVASIPQLDTFLFYYSGHHDANGFQIGSHGELLTVKELQEHILSMINKSSVKRVLVLLDCCFAPNLNLRKDDEQIVKDTAFFQLNSCSSSETTHARFNDPSQFTQIIIKALTGRSTTNECKICNQFSPNGGLILIDDLLRFVRNHMNEFNTSSSQRSVTYFTNSDNIENRLVFAYYIDMKVEFVFQLECLEFQNIFYPLSKLPDSYLKLQLDLFQVVKEKYGFTPISDVFADVLTIEVRTGPKKHHSQRLQTLEQIQFAWNDRRKLYVRPRQLSNIIDGTVGCFLKNENANHIFNYLHVASEGKNTLRHFKQDQNVKEVGVSLENNCVRTLWQCLKELSRSKECSNLEYLIDQLFQIKRDQKLNKGMLVFTFPLMDNGEPIQNFYTLRIQMNDVLETF